MPDEIEKGMTPEQIQRLRALEYQHLVLERQNAKLRYLLQVKETQESQAA